MNKDVDYSIIALIAQGHNTIAALSSVIGRPYARSQRDTAGSKRQRGIETQLRRYRRQGLIEYNRSARTWAVVEGKADSAWPKVAE